MEELRDYLDAYVVVLELEGGNDFIMEHRDGVTYMKKQGSFSIKISGYVRNQIKLDIMFNRNRNWRLYKILESFNKKSKDSYLDSVNGNDSYFYSIFKNQKEFLEFFMRNVVGDTKAGV
jgi:hypothetical protein